MVAPPSKFLLNTLAAVVILGFVAVIGFSVWQSSDSRDRFGPTVLATGSGGQVYLNIGPVLYRLDADGRLRDRVALVDLGIRERHLTDLLELDDGTLLVGTGTHPDILSCRLEQRSCTVWLQDGKRPQSSFKMVRDDTRNRLVVVDGARHRILLYDVEGNYLDEHRGGARGLKFPNTPWLTDAGELVIADTNHHRLVALDAATLGEELWELPVANDLGNFRRIWPTDFVQASGGAYWAILDDDLLEHGDVILFDDSGTPLRRVDLPADWDPIRMRARRDDVLLAGFGSVDLVSVSLDGRVVQPFGDEVVRAELARVRAVRQRNDRWWGLWIWVAIVPLGLFAGVVGWLDHVRRQREQAAAGPPPQQLREGAGRRFPDTEDGVYWLALKPAAAKRLRFAQRGMYLLPLLVLALAVALLACCGSWEAMPLVLLYLVVTLPFLVIIVTGLRVMTGGRLGVTREQVVLARGSDPRHHYSPRQLVWSRNFVSSGDITVYTRNGWGPLYGDSDLQEFLQPRLAAARRLNAWQGHLFLLRAGEPLAWATTVGLLGMAGLVVYVELFL